MSLIKDDDQQLISRAVALLIKAPMLTLPQIMRAAKFTIAQSEDRALQMRVRRASKSKCSSKNTPTPHIGSEVDLGSPMPTVSTVTDSLSTTETGGTSTTSVGVVPHALQEAMRMTSMAKVKRVNNTKKWRGRRRPFRWASMRKEEWMTPNLKNI